MLKPQANHLNLSNLPPSFYQTFSGIIEARTREVLANKLTVEEAIMTIQQQGNDGVPGLPQ